MAQSLERRTAKRDERESSPPAAVSAETWGQLCSPHFAYLSEETPKVICPVYLVSIPGEVKYPTQGNGENLSWTHRTKGLGVHKLIQALPKTCSDKGVNTMSSLSRQILALYETSLLMLQYIFRHKTAMQTEQHQSNFMCPRHAQVHVFFNTTILKPSLGTEFWDLVLCLLAGW